MRGDDAAGPILIRRLWELGSGDHARLVDGGTAGMDVAFQMRGAKHVILVDACVTGDEPGTMFRVPGEAITDLPTPTELHSHSFRWDHALAFGKWLLKEHYPDSIEVWLIEAESAGHGAPLTPKVAEAVEELSQRLAKELEEAAASRP